jgi:hypothetical protein
MGDDDRPLRGLERGSCGLHIGVSKIDENAQPITFLDDGCSERG